MTEENKNTITYDDGWKSVSFSEYPDLSTTDETDDNTENIKNVKKKSDSPRQLVITVQLICCILIALAAFIMSIVGGDVYAATREWYYDNLNNSVIFDSDNYGFNISEIFGATADEVSHT